MLRPFRACDVAPLEDDAHNPRVRRIIRILVTHWMGLRLDLPGKLYISHTAWMRGAAH